MQNIIKSNTLQNRSPINSYYLSHIKLQVPFINNSGIQNCRLSRLKTGGTHWKDDRREASCSLAPSSIYHFSGRHQLPSRSRASSINPYKVGLTVLRSGEAVIQERISDLLIKEISVLFHSEEKVEKKNLTHFSFFSFI